MTDPQANAKAIVTFAQAVVDEAAAASGVTLTPRERMSEILAFVARWLVQVSSQTAGQQTIKIDWGGLR